MKKETIAVWFSSGVASAIASKKTIEKYGKTHNVIIVNNPVVNEHKDNLRFLKDCEKWFGQKIVLATNKNYPTCNIEDVFDKRKYISGITGASCTKFLKKEARYQFEKENNIDWHVLGFTIDEWKRQKRFNTFERNNVIPVLITELITKEDCFKILKKAGIKRPKIYDLGFPNANCIGCVKSQSPTYWNLVRKEFPQIFKNRAEQSRRLGAKLIKRKGKRIFLDELLATDKGGIIKSYECGIFCETVSELENSKSNYKGRQKGTKTPSAEFLKKNKTIANAISKNPDISLRKIAIKTGVSHSKVAKVKKMLISEKKYQFDLLESIKDIESKE
ncbi:hypothetical protein LNJ08_08630 [Tenacibaculum finnmarkense genomovar ulcerans]|uniref:hypothetical protein n=1 Tax=Tenacibaculum finnmarkense TaxID=2781243 RepID=UPI001E65D5C8|nr:hypothetical protein [Tenacibaculum finnmarkense]MCD8454462.1 hypothetical protein [Tenacibaculum finnmarkense genomovar ulcerans]